MLVVRVTITAQGRRTLVVEVAVTAPRVAQRLMVLEARVETATRVPFRVRPRRTPVAAEVEPGRVLETQAEAPVGVVTVAARWPRRVVLLEVMRRIMEEVGVAQDT